MLPEEFNIIIELFISHTVHTLREETSYRNEGCTPFSVCSLIEVDILYIEASQIIELGADNSSTV